jgi:hypothetical protein
VWALAILCTSTFESEVFVLEDHASPTLVHRHKLHASHPRLGEGQVDGEIQMRKEAADVAVRKAERELNKRVTVLRAARNTAQSRDRDAHSDAESLAAAKANFASRVEDSEAAEMARQAVQSEATKEKAKLLTEEAREEQAVQLAKAREKQVGEALTAATQQVEKGGKLSEIAIAHAQQHLQDKTLRVTITQEHRLTTRIEAEKMQMEAAAASRAATSKLADFGRQQRASRKKFEQQLRTAEDKLDTAVSERGLAHSRLVTATEESKRTNGAAAVASADVKRVTRLQEDRVEQASKKADKLSQQHQQDVAQYDNAKRGLRNSKSALQAAQEAEASARDRVQETGQALWEVQNMGGEANRLQEKVTFEKRKLQIAERHKAKLLKEQIRAQVMLNDAKRSQTIAEESLGAAKDEQKSAKGFVEDARNTAKSGMKHSKELELAADTASKNENAAIGVLEGSAREMRKHRRDQLESSRSNMREQLKEIRAALIAAEGEAKSATVVASQADGALQQARGKLQVVLKRQKLGVHEAERKAEEEIHNFNRQSDNSQAMATSDAAQALEVKLAQIASDLTMAQAKKQEAQESIDQAKKDQENAEIVRKNEVEHAKAEAERTVQLAEQQHKETKQRDQKEVNALLERAQRSQGEVGGSDDPEAKAAAAAKLQAFAESAAKLANDDNEEMKAEKEEGEVLSEQASEGERQTQEEARRREEASKAQAQRIIEGARLRITAATEKIGELKDKQTKLRNDSAARVQKAVREFQDKAIEQIAASKATLKATKASLEEDVAIAQRHEQQVRAKAETTSKALEAAQDAVQQHKALLENKQADEMKMLNKAHANLAKGNEEALAQVQQQKQVLGSEVTVARQQAVQAKDGVPRLRDSVVAARAALQQADEATRYGRKEIEYHAKAAAGAENELSRIKLDIPAAEEAVQMARKRVADATKQADAALKTASGDTTTVKLKHERAQAAHEAAVQKLAAVNNAIATAEATEANAAATATEAGHAADKAESDAVAQKSTAKTEIAAAEDRAKKATEDAHQAEKQYEEMVEAEKAAALKEAEATAAAEAAKKALEDYDTGAAKDFVSKQQEVSVDVDAAEEKSKAASEVDDEALKAADDAILDKQQAEAQLSQTKAEAKANHQVAVAQKDSADQELQTSRDAITQQEAHLASFKDNAANINSDFVRKIDQENQRYEDRSKSAERAKQEVADANTIWLKADGKSNKAAKAFRAAADAVSEQKDTWNAAKREDKEASNAFEEAKDALEAEKRAKAHEEISEARMRATVTERRRDDAVRAADFAEEDLPKKLTETRQQLKERTEKARKLHKDRLKTIKTRSSETIAVASKNVEVATAGQIQAEMDAEKADAEASHVAKLAAAKIESARASATKGIDLAKRRSKTARQRQTMREEESKTAAKIRDSTLGEAEKAVEAQKKGQIEHDSAADAEQVTLEVRDTTLNHRVSQVDEAQKKQKEYKARLARVTNEINLWSSRVKAAEDEALVAKSKADQADINSKAVLLKAQFQSNAARSRSTAEEKTAKEAAQAVEEQAQMQLDAVEQRASVELDLARSKANEKEGLAEQAAKQEVRNVEAVVTQEMQRAEEEREDALSRWRKARETLDQARAMRADAATRKQQYELEGKKHQHDMMRIRKQMRIDEKRRKSEEREADTKHKEKVRRMELEQKAIAKAKADELAAKERWHKSTLAPTGEPTTAPTATPTTMPTNLPTVAPTIPPLCRNASTVVNASNISLLNQTTADLIFQDINDTLATVAPTPEPTSAPTSAPTVDQIFQDLEINNGTNTTHATANNVTAIDTNATMGPNQLELPNCTSK